MGCIIQISPHLEVSYNTSAGQQIAVLGGQHYTLLYIYTSIHLYIYTSIHLYTFIHLCLGRSAAPLLPVPGQNAVTGGAALYITIHLNIYTSIYIYTSTPGQVSSSTFASSRADCSYWGGSTPGSRRPGHPSSPTCSSSPRTGSSAGPQSHHPCHQMLL